MIETGRIAPDFTLPRDGGDMVTLSDQRPAKVVLYFYPKDNTPGCTTEALDFSALAAEFAEAGVRVFGISRDSVKKHENFCARHGLRVALLSDEDGATCEAYGVWVEKQNYGKTYMGIERSTFLIDAQGQIAKVWRKVKVKDHAAEVLEAARGL